MLTVSARSSSPVSTECVSLATIYISSAGKASTRQTSSLACNVSRGQRDLPAHKQNSAYVQQWVLRGCSNSSRA